MMRTSCFIALACFIIITPDPAVLAATFTVNDFSDAVDVVNNNGVCATASGTCTLRAAVQESNTYPGSDAIILPAGTYALTITASGRNNVSSGDLNVISPVSITGASAADTIIVAQNGDRVFKFSRTADGSSLAHLSITAGASPSGSGIHTSSSLTLDTVGITGNASSTSGGGIYLDGSASAGTTLIVRNSTISGNTAAMGAGITAKAAVVKLSRTTVSGNAATGDGGGFYTEGSGGEFTLYNVTVTNNTADADADGSGDGGGMSNTAGVFKLKNSILAENIDSSVSGNVFQNCSGSVSSLGYISSDNVTGCSLTADSIMDGVTLMGSQIGLLADNGGETKSHALSYVATTANPAIDAGDPVGCTDETGASISSDQIGRAIADGNGDGVSVCDLGSYEYADITLNWVTLNAALQSNMGTNAAVYDDKLYAFGLSRGDFSTDFSQIYDPSADSWSEIDPAMPTSRESAVVALLDDKIYVIGGNNPETCGGNYRCAQIASVEIYDPVNDAWTEVDDLNHARDVAIVGVWDDKIFLWGGMTYEALVDEFGNSYYNVTNHTIGEYFDIGDGQWHDLTSAMPYAVRSAAYAQIGSMLYVFGGCSLVQVGGNNTCTQQIVQSYDMATDTWTLIDEVGMPTGRHFSGQHAAAVGDKIIVFGGATDAALGANHTIYDVVEIYDTVDGSWTNATAMPVERKSVLSGIIDHILYVAGGSGSDIHVESVDLSGLE